MGLLILDMTTGKDVDKLLTMTFDTSTRINNATCSSVSSGGKVNIKPSHEFNTTSTYTSSFLNANSAEKDCYYILKCSNSVVSNDIKIGCSSIASTEYWSDINVGGGLYSGQCFNQIIKSDRDYANLIANFTYSGTPLEIKIPWYGNYVLNVYGAQGGSVNSTYIGGLGAIVSGKLNLNKNNTLYVYVGEQGKTDGTNAWNGGGHMHIPYYNPSNKWINQGSVSCGGGGATDIALQYAGTNTWKTDAHLYSRLIVAGGGGGAFNWTGEGGHASGGNGFGNASNSWYGCNGLGTDDPGKGATLSAGGGYPTYYANSPSAITASTFGCGASMDLWHNDTWHYEAAGAGGGGWYGGGVGGFGSKNGSGGGGSSYAWTTTSNLHNYYPNSSYKPSTSYYLTDVQISSSGNSGKGKAVITCTTVN